MKKSAATVAMIALSAMAYGCKQPAPQVIADQATKQLGIPVFLWAFDNDVCANRQLSKLVSEVAGSGDKASVIARLNGTYKAIVLLESQKLGDVTGTYKLLQLVSHRRVVETKTLADTRANASGVAPGTRIDKGNASDVEGKVLTLQPTTSDDRSERTVYYTYDQPTFSKLGPDSDEFAFEDAIDQHKVMVNTSMPVENDPCGKLASLSDLF
jgi:hypothetical protein